jgi:hypothetical protein
MSENQQTHPVVPQQPAPVAQPYTDPDEINLLEYAYVLVKRKWVIIGLSFLGLVAGYVTAVIVGPSYEATAIIAPREVEGKATPNLSALGGFGGLVASQMGLGGNASLEKLEIVLDSRKFNGDMLETKGLLPELYRYEFSDAYKEIWDPQNNDWLADSLVMPYAKAGGYVKSELLQKEINKNNTMTLTVKHPDSLFAFTLLSGTMEHLDEFVRKDVQKEARENRDYLEAQLISITDPLLRNKIQELIASEVEKMMVVSKEAFRVIDPVYVSKDFKSKKLFPLVFGAGLFFLSVLGVVFSHALTGSDKTPEDMEYLEGIRAEMKKLPFGK